MPGTKRSTSAGNNRKSPAGSLRVKNNADGSASIDAKGPAVAVAMLLVTHLVVLVLAAHRATTIAAVAGATMGLGIGWLVGGLATGRLSAKTLLDGAEFKAKRKPDGSLDLLGIGTAAWPLGALLSVLFQYLLAPTTLWVLAVGAGVAFVLYSAAMWYVYRSRRQREMADAPQGPA